MSIGLIASANVMPLYLYHDPVMRCSSLASDLDFACGMGIHYFMQNIYCWKVWGLL